MATKVRGRNIREVMSASTLIGDSVVNSKGQDLGSLEEIMIHIPSGRIAYAVLSFGGFLGMGDKLFAIPWEALTVDEENKQLVLDIDQDKLEKAPGFNKDHWPDMADPTFTSQIYGYYGYQPFLEEKGGFVRGSERSIDVGESVEDCERRGTC